MWGKDFPKGCAHGEEAEHRHPCKPTRILYLEMALRRALVPDAFDERARIMPGRLMDVLEAEAAAIRQVAALKGPIPANLNRPSDV